MKNINHQVKKNYSRTETIESKQKCFFFLLLSYSSNPVKAYGGSKEPTRSFFLRDDNTFYSRAVVHVLDTSDSQGRDPTPKEHN